MPDPLDHKLDALTRQPFRAKGQELTREELREMAIFLTHYVGFPLGSKLDGAVKRVTAKRKKAVKTEA